MNTDDQIIIKLLLAMLVGGSIGLERELSSKSAGFRTLMLICIGATLFTVFSMIIGAHASPDRIASNVVVGIGFIGAGVIFRSNNRVNGITTAASIWVTAALGIGIGCGYYFVAVTGCFFTVAILFLLTFFDHYIERANQIRIYKIVYPYEEHKQHVYEELLKKYTLRILNRTQSKNANIITGLWTVQGKEKNHRQFIALILQDEKVSEFSF